MHAHGNRARRTNSGAAQAHRNSGSKRGRGFPSQQRAMLVVTDIEILDAEVSAKPQRRHGATASRDAAHRDAQPPALRQTMADDENNGRRLHHFVVGLLILGGLAVYLLLYEPNGLLGVGLLVFATLFQMFWPPLLARITPGLPMQTKVPIWFFFFSITVGVIAIWLLFANLLIVLLVTAAWLVLFVADGH
jgi:hypothetical protein